MAKLSIRDLDVRGKRVFIRVDFNVPIKEGRIKDDTRVRASLPTIKYALEHGATVILASHLGRPRGGPSPEFSLEPVAAHLAKLLDQAVSFATDCVGDPARKAIDQARAQGHNLVVLETVRFHKEAEKNDPAFAKQLAELADLYVNDAFGSVPDAASGLDAEYYEGKGTSRSARRHTYVGMLNGAADAARQRIEDLNEIEFDEDGKRVLAEGEVAAEGDPESADERDNLVNDLETFADDAENADSEHENV